MSPLTKTLSICMASLIMFGCATGGVDQRRTAGGTGSDIQAIEISLMSSDGEYAFDFGSEITIEVSTNTDGYMNCYLQRDESFIRVFPNRFSVNGFVSASQGLILPDSTGYSLVVDSSLELIHCFLATRNIDANLPVELQAPDFEQLSIYSVDQIEEAYAKITNNYYGMASYLIFALD